MCEIFGQSSVLVEWSRSLRAREKGGVTGWSRLRGPRRRRRGWVRRPAFLRLVRRRVVRSGRRFRGCFTRGRGGGVRPVC